MRRFSSDLVLVLGWTTIAGCGQSVVPPPQLTAEQEMRMKRDFAMVHEQERQHQEQTRKVQTAARRAR
jgi:hypothetical protein